MRSFVDVGVPNIRVRDVGEVPLVLGVVGVGVTFVLLILRGGDSSFVSEASSAESEFGVVSANLTVVLRSDVGCFAFRCGLDSGSEFQDSCFVFCGQGIACLLFIWGKGFP
jgi:hypothetical protein